MKTKYRIVNDHYLGFEVQVKRWWWPWWYQLNWTNSHSTIEEAKEFIKSGGYNQIKRLSKRKVYYQTS